MVQWVEVLAVKLGDMSLIKTPHGGRKVLTLASCLISTWHTCVRTHCSYFCVFWIENL